MHSASDRGSEDLMAYGDRENLKSFVVHVVRQWRYSTEAVDDFLLTEADNVRPQHLPETQKSFPTTISTLSSSSFQVRYRRLDDTLYWKHCQIGGH